MVNGGIIRSEKYLSYLDKVSAFVLSFASYFVFNTGLPRCLLTGLELAIEQAGLKPIEIHLPFPL